MQVVVYSWDSVLLLGACYDDGALLLGMHRRHLPAAATALQVLMLDVMMQIACRQKCHMVTMIQPE